MNAASLALLIAEKATGASTGNTAVIIAVFTMISAIGVALINAGFSYLTHRYGEARNAPSRAHKLVAKQAEAYERFIILQGFDPRKIKDGYEDPEVVRRAET